MKILGQTQSGFIVEIKDDELANVAGKSCSYNEINVLRDGMKMPVDARNCKIGDEIDISLLYKNAANMSDHWRELNNAISSVKASATKFQNAVKDY